MKVKEKNVCEIMRSLGKDRVSIMLSPISYQVKCFQSKHQWVDYFTYQYIAIFIYYHTVIQKGSTNPMEISDTYIPIMKKQMDQVIGFLIP